MNKLYRLYFYLRFWIAQATKKFIEFFSDTQTEMDVYLGAFPSRDLSNHIADFTGFQVSGTTTQANVINSEILVLLEGEAGLVTTQAQIIEYKIDGVEEFLVSFNNAQSSSLAFSLYDFSDWTTGLVAGSESHMTWIDDIQLDFNSNFYTAIPQSLDFYLTTFEYSSASLIAADSSYVSFSLDIIPEFNVEFIAAQESYLAFTKNGSITSFYINPNFIAATTSGLDATQDVLESFDSEVVSCSPKETALSDGVLSGFKAAVVVQ